MPTEEEGSSGIDRRSLLKRGAILGGALVWTAPVVQSIASPALAATGTPSETGCSFTVDISVRDKTTGTVTAAGCVEVGSTVKACCDALTAAVSNQDPVQRFLDILAALTTSSCTDSATFAATDCSA